MAWHRCHGHWVSVNLMTRSLEILNTWQQAFVKNRLLTNVWHSTMTLQQLQ